MSLTDAQVLALIAGGSGVLGALFGGLASIIGQTITARADRRQDRIRLAVQLAVADYQARIDAMKAGLLPAGQRAVPLALNVDYHARILAALDKGELSPETMKRLHEGHTAVKAQLDAMPGYRIPPQ
jgi:hypothetical protein